MLLGGVAQLGERLLCKQEVIGSIPFTSTTNSVMSDEWRVMDSYYYSLPITHYA